MRRAVGVPGWCSTAALGGSVWTRFVAQLEAEAVRSGLRDRNCPLYDGDRNWWCLNIVVELLELGIEQDYENSNSWTILCLHSQQIRLTEATIIWRFRISKSKHVQ